MATAQNSTASDTLTVEERQKQIDSKTSFGRYSGFVFSKLAISLAGYLAGGAAFYAARNTHFAKKIVNPKRIKGALGIIAKRFPENSRKSIEGADLEGLEEGIFTLIGMFIGGYITGIINRFDIWKKFETERLAVNNASTDVAKLMDDRNRMADMFNQEQEFVKGIIAKGYNAGKPYAESIGQQKASETGHLARA